MKPEVLKYIEQAEELVRRGYYPLGTDVYTVAREMAKKRETKESVIKDMKVIPIAY